jgi:small GTP-binding protein
MFEIPQLKIVFLGDSGVGKTCLLRRWSSDQFSSQEPSTIATGVESIEVEIGDVTYCLVLWDTAGQENYRSLAPSTVRGADAVVLVFDVTRRESFDSLPTWIDLMHSVSDCDFVILGNKDDLSNQRKIEWDAADDFAKHHNVAYYEASARTGQGIDDLFDYVCGIAAAARNRKATSSVLPSVHVHVSGTDATTGQSMLCC